LKNLGVRNVEICYTTSISAGITSQCVYNASPPEDTLVRHIKAV